MRLLRLRARPRQRPGRRLEVELVPPHAGGFFAALPEQQPQPHGVAGGAGLRVESGPERPELVVAEHAIARVSVKRLMTRAAGCASTRWRSSATVNMRRDERLDAVDAERQPLAGDRVEQLVDVRARDVSSGSGPQAGSRCRSIFCASSAQSFVRPFWNAT